ncbi:3-keto-5-aminohexanoate cleavage protein [Thermodesulfobacteriota bacterium]
MDKLIITAAITGGASPAGNPGLPKTPAEQVKSTLECYEAGASVVHIHARNPETCLPEQKTKWFEEAIVPIREQCDILVNVTTGGCARRVDGDWLYKEQPEESVKGRISIIPELSENPVTKPDLASFNAGSPVIDIYNRKNKEFLLKFVMVHSFPDMVHMAEVMKAHNVKPEIECYDVGMINNAKFLTELGYIEEPPYFQLVMGILGQIPANVDNLIHMVRCIPEGSPWSVCAVGMNEFPMTTMAMIMGGHIRVGFEDNIYLAKGVPAKSNAELVAKAVRIAKELGREIATPDEAREILHLPPRQKS